MGEHLLPDGRFQSDKYDWAPPDFVPLKITDRGAQDALYRYAIAIDANHTDADPEHLSFAIDILTRLEALGYKPPSPFDGLPKIDPDTPTGAAVARDHAIARAFNRFGSILARAEPFIDQVIETAEAEAKALAERRKPSRA